MPFSRHTRRSMFSIGAASLAAAFLFLTPENTHAADTTAKIHILTLDSGSNAIVLESVDDNGQKIFGMVDSGEDWDYPDGSDPRYPLRSGITTSTGYDDEVLSYLDSLGVTSDNLQFYVATHPHSDHIGTGDTIVRLYSPDRVYLLPYDDSYIYNTARLWDNLYVYDQLLTAVEETEGVTLIQRPETAQGIFVNFLNVQKTGRMKIPFGIAQIGKAFRNEIVARQFIFRMREFEQMEMQFFVRPGEELAWFAKWKEARMRWHRALGFGDDNYRFHDHEKLAHYANAAADIEFRFPFGFKEVEGVHSRTDFDLGRHEEFSGKKIRYYDAETGESYIPYVIETSIGVDRMVLQVLSAGYQEEKLENGEERTVLSIPAPLAPVKAAVLPLVKKDGLPEIAHRIKNTLRYDYNIQYDEKDSIGKRYRRQDAIGTPLCITIDHQSAEDGTVTVRDRDTMRQERVHIEAIPALVESKAGMRALLDKLA